MNRQQAEEYLGVSKPAKPAKVGKRTPTWDFNQAPSHWRKTLKLWALVVLIYIGISMAAGLLVGILEKIFP